MICEVISKDNNGVIGYNENAARQLWSRGRIQTWGQNLLGKVLIAIREKIKDKERKDAVASWEYYESE
jgi:hypothetical protein